MSKTLYRLGDIRYETPELRSPRTRLVRASDQLWRVYTSNSKLLGHLRAVDHHLGIRYRAERLQLQSGVFRVIGEFWSPDDAVQALAAP
jgi:hypothetical protein